MACFDVDSFETRFSSFSSSDVDVGLGVCGDAPWSWKGPPGAAIIAGILIGWARSWGVAPKSGDDDINWVRSVEPAPGTELAVLGVCLMPSWSRVLTKWPPKGPKNRELDYGLTTGVRAPYVL